MGVTGFIKEDYVSVLKSNVLFFLLIFSLYVGQGISYGPLCLFHLVLPIYFANELRLGWNWYLLFKKDTLPIHLFYLIIFGVSLLHPLNYSYLYYYTLGYFVFCLLWTKRDFIFTNFKVLFFFLMLLFSLDVILATLEFLTPFRYPISKLSEINHLFGRVHNMFIDGTECFNLNYVLSSPTGFHWNQNNLAFVFLVFFPFTFLFKNSWWKNGIRMLLFILILSTGSRLGFYAAVFIYFFIWIAELKRKQWQQIIPIMTLIFILTDGYYVFPTKLIKIKEVAFVSKSVFYERFPDHCYEKKNSKEARKELFSQGKRHFFSSILFGNGAGGFTKNMEAYNQSKKTENLKIVTNAHNFIIELLVDFGIMILLPFFMIFVNLIRHLKNKNKQFWLLSFLLGLAFMAGSIMVSSLVYFLPFYLFFFLFYVVVTAENDKLITE
jgi:hypothetical protein